MERIRCILKSWCIIIVTCSSVPGISAQGLKINGTVRDAASREACKSANIVLQTRDSLLVKGTTSDATGGFSFEKVAAGDYRVIVSRVGYTTQRIELPGLTADCSLGDILMEEEVIALNEVKVLAPTAYPDKKLIFPSARQVQASTNGVNLLRQLMLPKIWVDPLSDEVSLYNGRVLQFRVNGIEVELFEIKALLPSEIIHIEYYDQPGLRYGNAEVVLNYIVRRPEAGGSFGVDLSDAFNPSMWGNNSLSVKLNYKRSEWSAYYSARHRDYDNMVRENEEQFTFADGTALSRMEEGESGRVKMRMQYLNTTYSFVEAEKRVFKATFRFTRDDYPRWDYTGYLYNVADNNDRVHMTDCTGNRTSRPSVDLYYQENLKYNQVLVFNVVGTYSGSRLDRLYRESREGEITTDIASRADGQKYSVIGEGIYEKRFGTNRISMGIRHTQSITDNRYLNGMDHQAKIDQALTYAYGEFRGKIKSKLGYTLGVGVTRSRIRQEEGKRGKHDVFNPRVLLSYALSEHSSVRVGGNISSVHPSLSEISAVEQAVDLLQRRRGNPNLKSTKSYMLSLNYEKQKGILYANLWGYYTYHPKAIMEEKYGEGDKIIQTWNNQKDWQVASASATIRVGPVNDIFQGSLTGGVNHYISNGITYSHTYTNWFANVEMTATHRKLMLTFGLKTGWDWFYGETLSGGENTHNLLLQYNFKNVAIGIGAYSPFVNNYRIFSENWSRSASYQRREYFESARMFLVKFSYNLSFGRKFNSGQKRVDNQDQESGVMGTGK